LLSGDGRSSESPYNNGMEPTRRRRADQVIE
jgi:hypothetical protein